MKNKFLNKLLSFKFFFYGLSKFILRDYSFSKIDKYNIDARWGKLTVSSSVCVPINKVYVIIHSSNGYKKISIEESPHFNFIYNFINQNENFDDHYRKYIIKYTPEVDYEEKKKQFLTLYENISNNQDKLFICFKKELNTFVNKEFKVIDGLHRISIAKALGLIKVKGYFVDSIN